ncbi:hypothetical protein GCM10023091_25420 [Ravibacter arvi]|uniref:Peptidase C14 caspase domain-containing protein n=1 Tax=Ravibacter arvi TaxID=2051041 RepID=A0ABP8M224_9BACT
MLAFLLIVTLVPRLRLYAQVSSQGGEEIVAVARSEDGAALATVSSMGVVRVRDTGTNRVIREMNAEGLDGVSLNGCRRVFFLPGRRLGVLGFNELRIFDIGEGRRVAKYSSAEGFDNMVSSNNRYFVYFNGGLAEIVDLFDGKTLGRRAIPVHRAMDISPDGRYLFHFLEERKMIECMEIATGKIVYWLPADGIRRIILTRKAEQLIGITGGSAFMWDLTGRKLLPVQFKAETWDPDLPFVADEEWLVLPGVLHKGTRAFDLKTLDPVPKYVPGKSVSGAGPAGKPGRILLARVSEVFEYDLQTGAQLRIGGGVSDVYRSVCLSPDERFLFLGTEDGFIKYFDVREGIYRGVFMEAGQPVTSLRFSDDGRMLEIGAERSVDVVDYETREILRTYPRARISPAYTFIMDKARKLVATIIAGELSLSKNGMTLKITTKAGENKDYFVYESGSMLFDATGGGIDALGLFKVGESAISPRRLSETFYRPDLLTAFFSEGTSFGKIASEAGRRIRQSGRSPVVDLKPDAGKVTVLVRNGGGGIGRVNVYLNGKQVIPDGRKEPGRFSEMEIAFVVDPARYPGFDPARGNRVEVRAFNRSGEVASEKSSVDLPPRIVPKSGVVPDKKDAFPQPRLWALTVGVSDCADPALSLNFAARDAEDIYQALDAGGRILFENRVNLYRLTTNQKADSLRPTAANIRRVLQHISKHAGRDDVMMLYFAGHGQSSENSGPFYFLSSDAKGFAGRYGPDEAITDEDILRTFVNSRCGKQLLILDACYSGQVIDRMVARGQRSNSIRAFERMFDQSAAFILASSSSSQKSWESSEFGQGLLTHFLLEGMRGPSLDDGILTALKWMDYAKEGVEKYMEERSRAGGSYLEPQVPRIFSRGDIVPVAIAQFPDQVSLSKIPFNAPKPLAGPVTLLNSRLIDPLDLQTKVNRILSRSSPDQSPFYYMPDRDYMASYRLVGNYETDSRTGEILLEKATVVLDKAEKAAFALSGRFRNEEDLIEELVLKFAAFCEGAAQ